MAVDERRRHEMYLAFEELVGGEVATTMMEHLPPVGWADVATKHDVEREIAILRADMGREFGLVQAGFAELRDELHTSAAGLRSELHTSIADLQGELRSSITGLRSELNTSIADVRGEIARSSQRVVMWTIGVMVPGFLGLFAAILARG